MPSTGGQSTPVLMPRTLVLDHSLLSKARPMVRHATSRGKQGRTGRVGLGGGPSAHRSGGGLPFHPTWFNFEYYIDFCFSKRRRRLAEDFERVPDQSRAKPVHHLQRQEHAAIPREQRRVLRTRWPRGGW